MADLFDFADEPDAEPEQADWHEVPQARFLSWPEKMQLAYCAARDIDSAGRAATAEEIEWYLERARSYQEMANGTHSFGS